MSTSFITSACCSAILAVGALSTQPAQDAGSARLAFVQTLSDHRSVWTVDANGGHPRLLTPGPSDDGRAVPGPNGSVVFQSDRTGDYDLWSLARDGSEVNLTASAGDDFQPDVTADGTRIAFVSDRSGRPELWTMGVNGADPRRLTDTELWESQPAWSPDGRFLAFARGPQQGLQQIWILDVEARSERPVTPAGVWSWGPRWSPDGRTIAFTQQVATGSRVALLDVATGGRTLMPAIAADNSYPTWSPDGTRLAVWANRGDYGLWIVDRTGRKLRRVETRTDGFESLRWTAAGFLYSVDNYPPSASIQTVRLDGSDRAVLTDGLDEDSQPAWSPDGRTITFRRFLGTRGSGELYTMRPDGTGVRRLTRTQADEQEPAWSPDGRRIAIASAGRDRKRLVDIVTMRADGSGRFNVTARAGNEAEPDWAPDGKSLVYAQFAPYAGDSPPPGDIWQIRPDGSGARRLLGHADNDEQPKISPDGQTIVFSRGVPGRFALHLMNRDGSNVRRLLVSNTSDWSPEWSPDGTQIAFVRETLGSAAIWVVDADGRDEQKVVDVCVTKECVSSMTPPTPTWGPPANG